MPFPHANVAYSFFSTAEYIEPTPWALVSKLQPPSGVPPL